MTISQSDAAKEASSSAINNSDEANGNPASKNNEHTTSQQQHSSLIPGNKSAHLSHYASDTVVVRGGHRPSEWTTDPYGRSVVNPPVYHASTITFPTTKSLNFAKKDWPFTGMWYGRHGNPTTWALEEAFAAVEGGYNACCTASGVAAVNAALLAFLEKGDHILMTDAVYDPTRGFCDKFLKRFGVDTTYYDPSISGEEMEGLIQENTRVVFLESPASLSFEVQDIKTLAGVAKRKGAKVVIDNTWGPTLLKPLEMGCDVSINAATKYIGGHSDIMLGLLACTEQVYRDVKMSVCALGCPPGSDDAYFALRGLRTLAVRLKQQGKTGVKLAKWLEGREEVKRVMHPALESHPQHKLWKEQFSGTCGLFGFQLRGGYSQKAVNALLDSVKLYAMGYSWGGYESLLMQTKINSARSATQWKYGDGYGQTLRVHAGLEDVNDLIRDLEQGFAAMNEAT